MEFDFDKGTPCLKITVLNNEQLKARKLTKPKSEVKAKEWLVNKQPEKQK